MRNVSLGIVAILIGGCSYAAAPYVSLPRGEDGSPVGLRIATPAIPSRPAARPRATTVPTPATALAQDDALIAIVRASLWRRGFDADIVNQPITIYRPGEVWPIPERERAKAEIAWADGAVVVETAVGRWWAWEYGVLAPADREAARAEAAQRDTGRMQPGMD